MQAHYYIAFSILSTALEDSSFGLKGIHIANTILNYFYLGLLIWLYPCAIVGFALFTIYMTVSALVLAFKGLDQLVKEHKGSLGLGDFFKDAIFWKIVGSTTLYVFASLLFVSQAPCH
jgi:chitin synthase